jgi:hypothetical protein
MEWDKIQEEAARLVRAHPGLQPPQYAFMLQQQFRDVPVVGWFLLRGLHAGGHIDQPELEHE